MATEPTAGPCSAPGRTASGGHSTTALFMIRRMAPSALEIFGISMRLDLSGGGRTFKIAYELQSITCERRKEFDHDEPEACGFYSDRASDRGGDHCDSCRDCCSQSA